MSQVRTGAVSPLADGYVARPELGRALIDALSPGATAALVLAGADGRGRVAHPLLMFTSLLDGAGVPRTIFAEAAHRYEVPYDAAQGGLAALEAAGLLSPAPAAPPLVRVNWVVQAAIQAAMPPGVLDATAAAATDALLAARPPDGAERTSRPSAPSGAAPRACARWRATRYGPAAVIWSRSAPGKACRPGANHQVTLTTTLTLANACRSVGHLTDAVRLLDDTVQRLSRACRSPTRSRRPRTTASRSCAAAVRLLCRRKRHKRRKT